MIKHIVWHKGVMMACVPIAGIGGGVVGVEKADTIKSAYHRIVHKPKKHIARVPKTVFVHRPSVVIPESCVMPINVMPVSVPDLQVTDSGDTPSRLIPYQPIGYTPLPAAIGIGVPPKVTPTPPSPPSVPLPEPSTWLTMIVGVFTTAVMIRWGKKRKINPVSPIR